MPDTPVTREVVQFVVRVYTSTIAHSIRWTTTPHDTVLEADLGRGYTLELERVADFESGDPTSPDHILRLLLNNNRVLELDRLKVTAGELNEVLPFGEEVQYSYAFFHGLWDRAVIVATRLNEHLEQVNELLGPGGSNAE